VSDQPRYSSLRDYLRVLREQAWLIVALVLLFGAAGYAVSRAQSKSYTAEATLIYRDVGQDLSLLGSTGAIQSPQQLAVANAQLTTRPEITNRVRRQLGTSLSEGALSGMVQAQASATSNLVLIDASSGDPKFAADLANAFAHQSQVVANQQLRRRLDQAISTLRGRIRDSADPSVQNLADSELNQLVTLRQIARPVELGSPASVPIAPSSPQPTRNAILGALIGLALGLLAAFVRDSLDRRVRTANDAHEILELPILGRVSEAALGFAIGSNGQVSISEADFEAFKALRMNLDFMRSDEDLTTILVTSGAPEEGKSTVAMALAASSAMAGKRCLLVECDLRRPSLAARMGIEARPGLSDFLVGQAAPQDILRSVELPLPASGEGSLGAASGNQGLVCICAGSVPPFPAELLGSERFEDFLDQVGLAYDLVVLDSSPFLSAADTLELVPLADGVLICLRLTQATREQASAVRDVLGHLPSRPTGLILTGLRPGSDAYGYYYHAYEPAAKA